MKQIFYKNGNENAKSLAIAYVDIYPSVTIRGIDMGDLIQMVNDDNTVIAGPEAIELINYHLSNDIKLQGDIKYQTLNSLSEAVTEIQNRSGRKNVVYTCIIGNYDRLKNPKLVSSDWDYICITDNATMRSNIWKIVYITNDDNLDNRKFQRNIKILYHLYMKAYENTLYIDGSFEINSRISEMLKEFNPNNSTFAISSHPERKCIYDEMDAVIQCGKDTENIVNKVRLRYLRENVPNKMGLTENGIMYRKHTSYLYKLMEHWWNEIEIGSYRDQLSFMYAVWKTNYTDMYIASWEIKYKYFRWVNHIA